MQNITIYSTATCGYCRMLKSYLQSKSISYNEKMVDEDPSLAQELVSKSGQLGVPFTVITTDDGKEEKILGFDKQRVDEVLKLA